MALKHLDSLLNVAVPSREEAVALGGVDVGEQGRHRVVVHEGVGRVLFVGEGVGHAQRQLAWAKGGYQRARAKCFSDSAL